jgi:hypothetical protein
MSQLALRHFAQIKSNQSPRHATHDGTLETSFHLPVHSIKNRSLVSQFPSQILHGNPAGFHFENGLQTSRKMSNRRAASAWNAASAIHSIESQMKIQVKTLQQASFDSSCDLLSIFNKQKNHNATSVDQTKVSAHRLNI